MRINWLIMGAFLGLLAPPAAAAQTDDVVVYASSARAEIERILRADNLDTDTLASRVVADAMAGIKRGQAPDDFWRAYQAHVRAWHQLAVVERLVRDGRDAPPSLDHRKAVRAAAERRIGTTFDVVERIARRYGVRLPVPRPLVKSRG